MDLLSQNCENHGPLGYMTMGINLDSNLIQNFKGARLSTREVSDSESWTSKGFNF